MYVPGRRWGGGEGRRGGEPRPRHDPGRSGSTGGHGPLPYLQALSCYAPGRGRGQSNDHHEVRWLENPRDGREIHQDTEGNAPRSCEPVRPEDRGSGGKWEDIDDPKGGDVVRLQSPPRV